MIVDDESLALSRLKRLLNENGIEDITAFDNPIEALKEITKTKFDAVFLDISMPNITGLELADSIIQLEPKTFIIFQTAYSEFALEAYKSGGMGYLIIDLYLYFKSIIFIESSLYKTPSNVCIQRG